MTKNDDKPKADGAAVTPPEVEKAADMQPTPETPPMPENALPPDLMPEEQAILEQEGKAALEKMGEELPDPPAPFDFDGEHIPAPDNVSATPAASDVVVPFEKINEIVSEKQKAAQEAELRAEDKPSTQEKPAAPEKPAEKKAAQRGKASKAEKSDKPEKPPKAEKPAKQAASVSKKTAPAKEETPSTPPEPTPPPEPRDATRGETEQIVYLNLSELHAFKNHPFGVRDDSEMRSLVESVRTGGVNQPAIVRPREDGGYEIVAGHRRHKASEMAGYANMPCIVRNMTDDEAILAMTDDNLRQRSEILPSEKAMSLKMQVEAIKHQGARDTSGQNVPEGDIGKRSTEIVGERNNMNYKQVQGYIRLTSLVPDLIKAVDEKKLGFTSAVEISFIRPKNQNFIAVAIEGEQSSPSLSQAQRMRELDQKGLLNSDVIDGIMCEQKKEVDKVIISSQELGQYFGKDKTPQQMKEQIIKLLDEWAGKEKALTTPEKKADKEK